MMISPFQALIIIIVVIRLICSIFQSGGRLDSNYSDTTIKKKKSSVSASLVSSLFAFFGRTTSRQVQAKMFFVDLDHTSKWNSKSVVSR